MIRSHSSWSLLSTGDRDQRSHNSGFSPKYDDIGLRKSSLSIGCRTIPRPKTIRLHPKIVSIAAINKPTARKATINGGLPVTPIPCAVLLEFVGAGCALVGVATLAV